MDENLQTRREETTTEEAGTPQKTVKTTVTTDTPSPLTEDPPQKVYKKKKIIFRSYQVIWYILGIIEFLLAFRIILKLLGANPASEFASAIYALSFPFAFPFSGLFGVTVFFNSIVEWSSFVAMAVYFLLAYGTIALLRMFKPVDSEEVEQTVDNA